MNMKTGSFQLEASITELHMYRFDRVLFDTPTPDEGKRTWEDITGLQWPNRGWWTEAESLDTDVFDIRPNEQTAIHFRESRFQQNVKIVVWSERQKKLKTRVTAIIKQNDVDVDDHLVLEPELLPYIRMNLASSDITRVVIYDDSGVHKHMVDALASEYPNVDFVIFVV